MNDHMQSAHQMSFVSVQHTMSTGMQAQQMSNTISATLSDEQIDFFNTVHQLSATGRTNRIILGTHMLG